MNSKRNMLVYDRSSTGLWVALIFLVSLNLRPAIAAVGPVLAQMGTDLAWGEGVQGVLTAIPLIAFAVVSPLVTFLARRIGIDIIEVIKGGDISKEAYTGDGEMINSEFLNGYTKKKRFYRAYAGRT